MTVTKDEARWIVHGVESWCQLQQWADDAVYARRALDRLRERWRDSDARWDSERREYVRERGEFKCQGWEREVLERQLLDYVLEHGYVPSKEHVKKLKENAAKAKKARPKQAQITQAMKLLAA